MEKVTVYIVQHWVEGYEFWSTCMIPSENMFGSPIVDYTDEGPARAHYDAMCSNYPSERYRLIKRTITDETI